jgi:PAS domain S-box-containing protein
VTAVGTRGAHPARFREIVELGKKCEACSSQACDCAVAKLFRENIPGCDAQRLTEALRQRIAVARRGIIRPRSPLMTFSGLPNGALSALNSGWLAYSGLRLEQAVGDGWIDVVHPEDRNALLEKWCQAVETGTYYEATARFRAHDGEYQAIVNRATPVRDAAGNIISWSGTSVRQPGLVLCDAPRDRRRGRGTMSEWGKMVAFAASLVLSASFMHRTLPSASHAEIWLTSLIHPRRTIQFDWTSGRRNEF